MTVYAPPGTEGSVVNYRSRYENWIGGNWVAPVGGRYFENPSPVNGKTFCEVAQSGAEDIELALDAAHAAAPAWGKTSVAERAVVLNKIADRIEQNLEMLAVGETWENGKPVRETLAADLPLAVDHYRYFAGAIRAQEGGISQLDDITVAYHFHEPLGVVGQIIPWNFPLLMATWKLAPALAAGNAVVLKPAEQTPSSILMLMELIADLLPPGVLNVVNGFGAEAGKPLASSRRIRKIAFTGETTTGRLIMQYASQNLIPVTLELGGKSPNVFFADVAETEDAFYDKALEGFAMFAFNQGEVCTCPSRALIQNSIIDQFLPAATERTKAMVQDNPLDTETQVGAQASNDQLEKILSYFQIASEEGARVITGGERVDLGGDLSGGYYVARRSSRAPTRCGCFRRRFRPGRLGYRFRGLRRHHLHRQRHPVRVGRRRLVARRQPLLPGGPGHPGRPGLDELLPHLSGPRGVRRLQVVRHRSGEPPDDAGALPKHQKHAGLLRSEPGGPLLMVRSG